MGFGASQHVTSQLSNLLFSQNYEGPDHVVIGDVLGLTITHHGSTSLNSHFSLTNVLYVPSI